MTIELARAQTRPKPWGVADLRPWSSERHGSPIGEVWYGRSTRPAPEPSLLLKLLFTSQPLSIQVHPDDAYAQSTMGLPNGKTEAWYILSAAPDAKIALGLNRQVTRPELQAAIDDGSIVDLVRWQPASAGDIFLVPAGTIHAIGAGLVIAEIQQRSDATFRMFDFGRGRELHVANAIAVADVGPAGARAVARPLSELRTLLISGTHFVVERVDLAPKSTNCLNAEGEAWLLVLSGHAHVGSNEVYPGDAVFADLDRVDIQAGATGVAFLVAYPGPKPAAHLLLDVKEPAPGAAARWTAPQLFPLPEPATAPTERVETRR
jgi:mannose-6-phosphate isomerase